MREGNEVDEEVEELKVEEGEEVDKMDYDEEKGARSSWGERRERGARSDGRSGRTMEKIRNDKD